MKYRNLLKSQADTYYFSVSKTAMFFTSIFAVFILYSVYKMSLCPDLAAKYYYSVPSVLKNVLLVCIAAVSVGVVFEVCTD